MSELKDQNKWPVDSAFHPDNVGPVSVIMLQRIYDLLMVIAHEANPEGAAQVLKAHRIGLLLSPAPSYTSHAEESESDSAE